MSEVSKRFELLVKSVYKKFIDNGIHLPQRTPEGILVGNVLIKSNGPLKDLVVNGTIAYTEISFSNQGQINIKAIGDAPDAPAQNVGLIATFVPDEETKLKKSLDGHIRIEPNVGPNGEEEIVAIEPNQQAQVMPGFLEKSNVNAVEEMVNSLDQQRKFEMHVKFIQMAEELDNAGASLMRLPGM